MRRILHTGVALALAVLAGGCIDLAEKLVSNLSNQYISTPEGLTAATNATYSQLRSYYGREQNMAVTELGTDLWMNGDQVAAGGAQNWEYFNSYNSSLNSQDARIQNFWNPLYVQINRANVVLENGPATPVGGTLTQAVKDSRLGEAYFLRALAYFELVQAFGDVTLNLTAASGVSTTAARAPAADVYAAIIADLDNAITLLPAAQPEWGRVRKAAAQHLLAKVYLTRAYKSFGQGQADFQKALSNAQAVITNTAYSLVPVYANLWCGTHSGTQPADPNRQGFCNTLAAGGFNEQNSEILFSVAYSYDTQQFSGPNGGNYLHLVFLSHYDGDPQTSQGLTRDIDNGRPFRRIRPTPYLISLFDQTRWAGVPGASEILDTRFDGSFQTLWFATSAAAGNATGPCPRCTTGAAIAVGDTALWMPGYPVADAFRQSKKFTIVVPCTTAPDANCGRDNKLARMYGWELFPALKKHQDNGRPSVAEQEGGKDLVLMRLGETYLIAAEADVALGNLTEAASYVNVLRVRAASANHKADPLIMVASGQMTLNFIMDERARELAGELNRWQDLVRPSAQFFVDRVKLHNPEASTNVALFHALRPIPQQQVNGVTGTPYPQNPGY